VTGMYKAYSCEYAFSVVFSNHGETWRLTAGTIHSLVSTATIKMQTDVKRIWPMRELPPASSRMEDAEGVITCLVWWTGCLWVYTTMTQWYSAEREYGGLFLKKKILTLFRQNPVGILDNGFQPGNF
jgi:hypothetical protein